MEVSDIFVLEFSEGGKHIGWEVEGSSIVVFIGPGYPAGGCGGHHLTGGMRLVDVVVGYRQGGNPMDVGVNVIDVMGVPARRVVGTDSCSIQRPAGMDLEGSDGGR